MIIGLEHKTRPAQSVWLGLQILTQADLFFQEHQQVLPAHVQMPLMSQTFASLSATRPTAVSTQVPSLSSVRSTGAWPNAAA